METIEWLLRRGGVVVVALCIMWSTAAMGAAPDSSPAPTVPP